MDQDRPIPTRTGASRWPEPAGARVLVPGFPQWTWRQRERALVLFGSYVAAMGVGIFAWGTRAGLVVLLFAFATHAFSAADAIRQYAFPSFGQLIPALASSAGLGTLCYAPALGVALVFAWPIGPEDRPGEGFVVDRWAYSRGETPSQGETVWLRPTPGRKRPRLGRVIAGPGQRVDWSGDQLRVDGRVVPESPYRTPGAPSSVELEVPEGHVLISFSLEPNDPALLGGWEIVDRVDIRGRAWARSYPIADRRLLR